MSKRFDPLTSKPTTHVYKGSVYFRVPGKYEEPISKLPTLCSHGVDLRGDRTWVLVEINTEDGIFQGLDGYCKKCETEGLVKELPRSLRA